MESMPSILVSCPCWASYLLNNKNNNNKNKNVQVHNPNTLCHNNKQIVTCVQELKYMVLHYNFGIDVVSWPLKKHPIVTLSSTKSKYVAATSATSHTILMHIC